MYSKVDLISIRATEANFATFNLVKEGEGDRVVYFYPMNEEKMEFSLSV